MNSPQVEAVITRHIVGGCLVDGGATLNVMANWFMKDLGLILEKPSTL